MTNTILTSQVITREALRVLHQKANFIGTINRQYDDSFAKKGALIGSQLRIRKPNRYVIRRGAALNAQATTEEYVALNVTNQMGVDMQFSAVDLSLSLDNFSKRVIEPAISVLAANLEADAQSMFTGVAQSVWNVGQPGNFNQVLAGRKLLVDSLAPLNDRVANLNSSDTNDFLADTKGLFNAQEQIARQYKEGEIGRSGSFDFYENTIWPGYTTGAANNAYVTNTTTAITGAGQTTLAVTAGSGAMNVGDTFNIAGVYRVHPETKLQTNVLHQFVVSAPYAGGAGNISFGPPIFLAADGGRQNVVVVGGGAGKALVFNAGSAVSTTTGTSLLYHEDAFTFATADLIKPNGVHFAGREVMDGISMRIVQQYDINADNMPCRVDVLYGYQALRPELAARLHNH
jgi:hypothetical protein